MFFKIPESDSIAPEPKSMRKNDKICVITFITAVFVEYDNYRRVSLLLQEEHISSHKDAICPQIAYFPITKILGNAEEVRGLK